MFWYDFTPGRQEAPPDLIKLSKKVLRDHLPANPLVELVRTTKEISTGGQGRESALPVTAITLECSILLKPGCPLSLRAIFRQNHISPIMHGIL
jgi:hypothetical protein